MMEILDNQNPGLRRRFAADQAFRFEDYNDAQLEKILSDCCKTKNYKPSLEFRERALKKLEMKKYPLGRTSLRSSTTLPASLFPQPKNDVEEEDSIDSSDADTFWAEMFAKASNVRYRSQYDASIYVPDNQMIAKAPRDEKMNQDFEDEKPFDGHFESGHDCFLIDSSMSYYCTDNVATKGEQQLSLHVMCPGVHRPFQSLL